MVDNVTLNASARTTSGKGAAKSLRRQGRVPAIVYGRGMENLSLTVPAKELTGILLDEVASHSLINLNIEGEGGAATKVVIVKDYQVDPVKRHLLHADFYEVDMKRTIQTEVPLVLVGKAKGLEKGGNLEQIRHDVVVSALPAKLPSQIEADVSGLDVGDSIHIEDLAAPEGVEFVYDVNFTLVTVVAPKGAKSEGEEELEGEESGEA